MSISQAIPFLLAPVPALLSLPVQLLAGRDIERDVLAQELFLEEQAGQQGAGVADGGASTVEESLKCNIPSHQPGNIKNHLFRDLDAMAAAAYAATILPASLVLVSQKSPFFVVVVMAAVLVPLASVCVIMFVTPFGYARLSRKFGDLISPYVVASVILSVVLAILAWRAPDAGS